MRFNCYFKTVSGSLCIFQRLILDGETTPKNLVFLLHLWEFWLIFVLCFFLDELASDEDEINEDDIQYIENLAKKVETYLTNARF